MSDLIIIALCSLIGTVLTTLIATAGLVLVAQINGKATVAKQEAAAARVAVVEVKETLEVTTKEQSEKLESIAKVGQDTLTHVNAQRGDTLRLLAGTSRWKANETGLAEDITAAELAEKNVAEHEKGQASVDAGKAL